LDVPEDLLCEECSGLIIVETSGWLRCPSFVHGDLIETAAQL
jgi:hypothetical protein